ncbi:MAG: AbrB/MazE/SpoVT family DNA-binding domain-containing protein [Patescibacteria group bacterium]
MAKAKKSVQCPVNSFFGTTTVGERGQVVIPKEVRKKYDIKPGDSLFVIGAHDSAIAFVPIKRAQQMLKYINQSMDDALKQVK